jgi:hypothetical protein
MSTMAIDLGFLLVLTLASAGLGLRIVRRLGGVPEHPADAWALALPIGLGALGLVMLGLGELGWLNTGAIGGLLGAAIVVGLPVVVGSFRHLNPAGFTPHPALLQKEGGCSLLSRSKNRIPPPLAGRAEWWVETPRNFVQPPQWSWAWDLSLLVVLLGTFLTALAPVTDGDALCYHLQVPKVFLGSGSFFFDPDLHETVYPLLTESLYAMALALRGPVACRLVQWLLGVAFALNVAALARPVLGDRAWWAASVALLVPAVSNGMGAPLNDVALAALGNAALFAWTRWLDRPTVAAAALAGILAGLAMGVKYPALVLAGLIALAMLASRRPIRHALVFGTVALMVGGVWYGRAYLYTGNPVYPFFRHVFGGSGLDVVLDPIKRPMAPTPGNLLTALVPMTLRPGRFDSVSHQFGPLFLLVLPALFLERAPRRVWALLAVGYAFLTLCLTQRQSMRFVLIAVGPMAVGVAWVASRWWDRRTVPARALVALIVGCLAFESAIASGRARHGLNVVLGRESAADFLARREPTYRVGRWVDANLPPDARIVGQDHRGYYIPRGYAMELAHRRRTGLGTHGESAETIIAALRDDGFTHLLLCPPEPEDAVEFDPTLGRLIGPWLKGREPLYRERIVDSDGVARKYVIYRLDEPSAELAATVREARR